MRLIKSYMFLTLLLGFVSAQEAINPKQKKPFMNTSDAAFLGNGNRISSILDEAKQFLSDAVIADVNEDTVEVVYNIKRIFDLLSDVEQLGVREELDKIEFEKFQSDFIQIYTTRLNTIGSSTQFLTADLIRRDIASITNENESVEMGTTKFTIIDDREGHIPLVTNSQVESYIRYFQGKGRKGFNIWLRRYVQYRDLMLPILKEHDLPDGMLQVLMLHHYGFLLN